MNRSRLLLVLCILGAVFVGGVVPAASVQTSLVPVGAKWKYLADGTDPGTSWRTADFDDSTWLEGAAKLGFGEDNESTVVGFGPVPEAKYTTTYFRHTFNVVDASALGNFLLRLLADDGAVVYLNGTEVFRSNMPEGEVSYSTFAASALSEPDESAFVTKFFRENRLRDGLNVIAVEVHQSDPASSDMAFDLALQANYQLVPPTVAIVEPEAGEPVVEGPLRVTVDAAFVGGEVTGVTLMHGDTVIDAATSAPWEFSWSPDPGEYVLTAVATTSEGLEGRSVPVSVSVVPALIRQGAIWKYLADGTNQGQAWRTPEFDDSGWLSGPAELGYGDGDEATVVPSGPDSTTNYITTYFRTTFNVDDPSTIKAIRGLLTYDDGAVVYLNGAEVFRINMPAGDPAFNAPATEATDYEPEPFTFAATSLRRGVNVVAVEVHQSGVTSSDISFNLMLAVAPGLSPQPAALSR